MSSYNANNVFMASLTGTIIIVSRVPRFDARVLELRCAFRSIFRSSRAKLVVCNNMLRA